MNSAGFRLFAILKKSGLPFSLGCMLFLANTTSVNAQKLYDSLHLSVGGSAIVGGNVIPKWIHAGQNGMVDFSGSQLLVNADLDISKTFGKKHKFQLAANPYISTNQSVRAKKLHISYSFGKLGILLGRQTALGGFGNDWSATGSFGISNNAQPIPAAQLGFFEYVSVPLTRDFVQIKGWLKHGWFQDDRYIAKPNLHEKHASLKLGKPVFNLSAGLSHFTIWNGVHPEKGEYPDRWEDFWRVTRGADADREYAPSLLFKNELNALGSHIGVATIGAASNFGAHEVKIAYQKIAEDGSGIELKRNKDHKITTGWKHKGEKMKLSLVVEHFKTTFQSGPGLPDKNKLDNFGFTYGGRDDYYNNGNYRSGWTHYGSVIGSPLFMTVDEANKIFETEIADYDRNIANNRVVGWHVALRSQFENQLKLSLKLTNTLNYGTYAGTNGGRYKWGSRDDNWSNDDYPFNSPLRQYYGAASAEYQLKKSIFEVVIALDSGQMYQSAGLELRFKYQIK